MTSNSVVSLLSLAIFVTFGLLLSLRLTHALMLMSMFKGITD